MRINLLSRVFLKKDMNKEKPSYNSMKWRWYYKREFLVGRYFEKVDNVILVILGVVSQKMVLSPQAKPS